MACQIASRTEEVHTNLIHVCNVYIYIYTYIYANLESALQVWGTDISPVMPLKGG